MSFPKEGSRYVDDGIIISIVPDICLTPCGVDMVPIPYTIWCRQSEAANLANSIRQTSDRSHAKDSLVLNCFGDDPGIGGGIYSATTGAECTPKTWSKNVRAENRNMVRHTDLWWMNHENTYGILVYTKDMNGYKQPTIEQITVRMQPDSKIENVADLSQVQKTQMAQGGVAVPSAGGAGLGPGSAVGAGVVVGNALSDKLPEGFRQGYNWNSVAIILGLPHVRVTQPEQVQCPPCRTASRIVPVGTLAYRHDLVPPSKPHFPFPGDHYNMYRANQYPPPKCNCFWQPIGTEDASGGKPPPPGSIPIEPFLR